MDSHRLKQFLAERGLLDLLKDFEAYCSSPASPEQPNPDLEMEVELNTNKEPIKRQLPLARLRALPPPPPIPTPVRVTTRISPSSQQYGAAKLRGQKPQRPTSRKRATDPPITGSPRPPKSLKRPTPKRNQPFPANRLSRFTTLQRAGEKLFSLLRQRPHGHTPRGGRNRPPPGKPQRPPPLFIHDKGRWTEVKTMR
ncbi:hypothetical protein EVAR_76956_1 [Eumeta japonica]|uniref:Uncharacterized protein n=1 Tax=Eumeta variegata TaxID=151549 RepID=A0A4C1SFQ6_EUMVA|nr:hypothetical protein EVAR_76956_1 [Eumeta japonica]